MSRYDVPSTHFYEEADYFRTQRWAPFVSINFWVQKNIALVSKNTERKKRYSWIGDSQKFHC